MIERVELERKLPDGSRLKIGGSVAEGETVAMVLEQMEVVFRERFEAWEALQALKDKENPPYLFPNGTGSQREWEVWQRKLQELAAAQQNWNPIPEWHRKYALDPAALKGLQRQFGYQARDAVPPTQTATEVMMKEVQERYQDALEKKLFEGSNP